jgi:hypothetical protein
LSKKKQAGLKTVGLSCSMATPFIPTGITPGDCPDQLAQERNDNAKTIKIGWSNSLGSEQRIRNPLF